MTKTKQNKILDVITSFLCAGLILIMPLSALEASCNFLEASDCSLLKPGKHQNLPISCLGVNFQPFNDDAFLKEERLYRSVDGRLVRYSTQTREKWHC